MAKLAEDKLDNQIKEESGLVPPNKEVVEQRKSVHEFVEVLSKETDRQHLQRVPESYKHPDGTSQHLFNPEKLSCVSGRIVNPKIVNCTDQDFSELNSAVRIPNDLDLKILQKLNSTHITGVPIILGDPTDYVRNNCYFIDPNGTINAISTPLAQRGVTFMGEGVVAKNNQVVVDHSVTGVGMTKSRSNRMLPKVSVGHKDGVLHQNVGNQIKGTNRARAIGILTPVLLPPLEYQEVLIDGEKIKASEILDEKPLFSVHHVYSYDVRIAGLYRGIECSDSCFSFDVDIKNLLNNLSDDREVAVARVLPFLELAKTVDTFNSKNGTSYFIGLSEKLNGDYSLESYVSAFRRQMAKNIALMITNSFWHTNMSMQNIAVSGEIGDWDSIAFYDENNDLFLYDKKQSDESKNETFYQINEKAIIYGYIAQSIVSTLLIGDHIGIEEFWSMVKSNLPQNHQFQEFTFDGLLKKRLEKYSDYEEVYDSISSFNKEFETAFLLLATEVRKKEFADNK